MIRDDVKGASKTGIQARYVCIEGFKAQAGADIMQILAGNSEYHTEQSYKRTMASAARSGCLHHHDEISRQEVNAMQFLT